MTATVDQVNALKTHLINGKIPLVNLEAQKPLQDTAKTALSLNDGQLTEVITLLRSGTDQAIVEARKALTDANLLPPPPNPIEDLGTFTFKEKDQKLTKKVKAAEVDPELTGFTNENIKVEKSAVDPNTGDITITITFNKDKLDGEKPFSIPGVAGKKGISGKYKFEAETSWGGWRIGGTIAAAVVSLGCLLFGFNKKDESSGMGALIIGALGAIGTVVWGTHGWWWGGGDDKKTT